MYALLSLLLLFPCSVLYSETVHMNRSTIDDSSELITIDIKLDKDQALLSDTLHLSVNSPEITLGSWKVDTTPTSFFDKSLQETKLGYQGTIKITVPVHYQHDIAQHTEPADLFMHYVTNTSRKPHEERFALVPAYTSEAEQDTLSDVDNPLFNDTPHQQVSTTSKEASHGIFGFVTRFKKMITNWVETTESRFVQFLLAFVLGIFMSLTPCIYPMIPITVGVLGTSSQNSLHRNFLLASSYAIGLATTFALLGILAAFFGTHAGQILSNPFFVIMLVALLAYLGFATLGLYELWIPRFMQPQNQKINRGSFLSAFFFGMGSGTIASPCMSPGLALVLSIVSSMGNIFLGFLLLFIFGIGASLPLLIIGTFSASLHFLPKAGVWMVEFKKVFGFMLLGICFYYLKNILPEPIAFGAAALFFLLVGGYYLTRTVHYRSSSGKSIAFALSIALFAASFYLLYQAYMVYTVNPQEILETHPEGEAQHTQAHHSGGWRDDYEAAREYAQQHNQKLLLDFGASWCSLCVELDKHVLHKPELTALFDKIVAVRVDGSSSGAEPYTSLIQEYSIMGIPTILLIDPTTGDVIKKWGSNLLDEPIQTFVDELKQYM